MNLLFSSFKGIRADLEFLLKEDLSSRLLTSAPFTANLEIPTSCCHHWLCFSDKVGSLDECNAELANYGPENFSSRITVKMKEGKETAVEKHNIQVSSFSGIFYLVSILSWLHAFIRFIHFRAFTLGEDKTWTRGPWTPTLDRIHGPLSWTGSMDPLSWTGSMDSFFLNNEKWTKTEIKWDGDWVLQALSR